MKEVPKHQLGDYITFKDPYWGKQSGMIDIIGYAGNSVVYRVELEPGVYTTCKEKQILKNGINKNKQ